MEEYMKKLDGLDDGIDEEDIDGDINLGPLSKKKLLNSNILITFYLIDE